MAMVSSIQSIEIIEAIRNGNNAKVLSTLYKTSLPRIIKYIRANNGDEQEAKDIFQDAVISLFTTVRLQKFDERKDVHAFLFFVARNMWITRIKRRNRQMNLSELQMQEDEATPLVVVMNEEKNEVIDRFLGKLGSKCQQMLKLVIYDNYSMKEIAQLMNLSGENVAKSTHYRCKQKLMELVEKDSSVIKLFRE